MERLNTMNDEKSVHVLTIFLLQTGTLGDEIPPSFAIDDYSLCSSRR